MAKDNIIIFDTTLRDGEQSPGASMTKAEKIRIAKMLELMKVDVIEAGFPIASPGDFEAVRAIAEQVRDSTICGLSRAIDADIDRAAEALKPAESARIHTFIATSPIHMKNKLRMSPDEVVAQTIHAVTRARNYTDNVEFSAEDAGRSEFEFLCRVFEAAIDAGASTINIPDTVGYQLPHLFAEMVGQIIETVPNADKAVFSVHCHNDLGLAVSNSLAAVRKGARQVECTINGLGERAGNAALEELVMAIRTRHDALDISTRIDTTHIVPTSRLVSSITGFAVQPNKAIVGANAFAHESGIHQDGVLKNRETYEIMSAQDVGWAENKLVLGKHSGRAAFKSRLTEIGIDPGSDENINEAFKRFKELADRKHEIFDEDLQMLMLDSEHSMEKQRFGLVYSEVGSKSDTVPEATVTVNIDGDPKTATSKGSGPVDAVFTAIKQATDESPKLTLYSVNAITSGTDAQGEVTVRLEQDGHVVHGHGAHTDIVIASGSAYVDALNKLHNGQQRAHPQHDGV